jgi:MFS family permease
MTTTQELPLGSDPNGKRGPSPGAILAVVGFSVFVAADDLTVVSTMLRPIIGDLGLVLPDGLDDAAWVVNAYLIAFVAIMPIAGRISDIVGRRRTFVAAYLLFLVGTILIPLSVELDESFRWFLAGRVLTAIGGGAMVPVALAVVGDVYPEGRRARALGTLGAIETMGWVWGPLYGAMLVRFLSWQWQFWLNIPLAVGGLAASWWALGDQDRPSERPRLDWIGASLLTVTLVSLNVALLGGAEIQSVNGLDELTGGSGPDRWWLYPLATATGALFLIQQSYSRNPIFDPSLFRGRNLLIALVVNFVVGAALVIAMVDVPLFVNSVEVDLERAAVYSGWILSALTAAMALTSYVGGRVTERWWYQPPILLGVAMSTGAYAWMGATWTADTSYPIFGVQLALLGAGFGLTVAPTTSAVVDAAPADQRGAAASLVMVVRLMGLSVGLSALTAWGLARFNELRSTIDLPGLTDPGFEDAVLEAQESLTAQAIAETFTAAAVVLAAGLVATFTMRRAASRPSTHQVVTHTEDHTMESTDPTIDPRLDPEAHGALHETAELTTTDEPADADETGAAVPATGAEIGALMRRMNILIGLLAALLVGAFVVIALLFGRVAEARDDAAAARSELASLTAGGGSLATDADLAALQEDVERVEAGAALYASQIDGFREQLVELEPEISAGVDEAITGLRDFGQSTIAFDVNIDEVIPVDTEVVIQRTVEVPIKTTIPIEESFDTTITIDTPVGGIPLDVTVPVDVDVPVDLVVDIPIDETVPIQDEFPVQLDVPIAIEVSETELASLTDSLAAGLESLQDVLGGLAEG